MLSTLSTCKLSASIFQNQNSFNQSNYGVYKSYMSRRIARETVFKLVFEYSFYDVKNENTLELLLLNFDLDEDDKKYVNSTYVGIANHKQELESEIESHLSGYALSRVYRPDLIAMMIAVYEMKFTKIPPLVSINEAVNLSKMYGTEKSGKFVNGVLAKVMKDVGENK